MHGTLDDTAKDAATIVEGIRSSSSTSLARIAELELELQQATERLRSEIKGERLRLKEAARHHLCQFADMTTRLRAVRALYPVRDDLGLNQEMLAFAIFGAPHKTWELRKLVSPTERTCEDCGRLLPCRHQFESSSFTCDECHISRRDRYEENETAVATLIANRAARLRELQSRSGLTDAEVFELSGLVFDLSNNC